MTHENIVGIDLGTTISVLAHMSPQGIVSVVPNCDGDPLTPSVVYLDGTFALVGKEAKDASLTSPGKVASFVKRDIGSPAYSRTVDGRQLRPETLSAIILKKLKQDAERRVGPINKAVITVPAFFNDVRRKATQDAGRIAGLDVIDIINEPTAAALAYCLEDQIRGDGFRTVPEFPNGKLTALVYDLGGGTFDVTSIRLEANRIDTLATEGAMLLGGKDWDEHIVDFVVEQFDSQFGITLPEEARHAIQPTAENVKKRLSKLPSTVIEYNYQGHQLRAELTREEYERRTAHLLVNTQGVTDLLAKRSRLPNSAQTLSWDDFDRVLLVGGSTRMPMVKRMLKELTRKHPDDSLDPDQVVAKGAAILCAQRLVHGRQGDLEVLENDVGNVVKSTEVVDVNAHALGIEVMKNGSPSMNVLIEKNQPLPQSRSKLYQLREGGITSLDVKVLEGDAPDPSANIPLGVCRITNLPRTLQAKSPVQVWLNYGTNGIVEVMALDMTGGTLAQAEIHRHSGLGEDDIQREIDFVNSLTIE